ncbi:MAG: hypothetical protein II934_08465 [Prevotella sp.]|nr:hypothetical protein [Prevotella sp.]
MNKNNELDDKIGQYLVRGFGSMSKNDFEVWIFYYLMQNHLNGKDNYDISVELRIPESKVKRLRYEAELKYGNPQDKIMYLEAFETLLKKSILKKDGSCVQFVVENLQLRKYLDSTLKKGGRFSNTSFNKEIVSIDIEDLEYLLQTFWPDNDWSIISKKAEKKLGKNNVTLKEIIKTFVLSSVQQTGKIIVNLTYSGILSLIS